VLIDFAGGDLDSLNGAQPVRPRSRRTEPTWIRSQWSSFRAPHLARAFRMTPKGNDPVDMRCSLNLYGEALTETWSYFVGSGDLKAILA